MTVTNKALRESLEACRRGSGLISRAAKEFHDERDAAIERGVMVWRQTIRQRGALMLVLKLVGSEHAQDHEALDEAQAENKRLRVERWRTLPDEDGEGGITWSMAYADHDMLLMDAERRVESAQAEVVRLQAALKRYGRDLTECAERIHGNPCDCGLAAALRGEGE